MKITFLFLILISCGLVSCFSCDKFLKGEWQVKVHDIPLSKPHLQPTNPKVGTLLLMPEKKQLFGDFWFHENTKNTNESKEENVPYFHFKVQKIDDRKGTIFYKENEKDDEYKILFQFDLILNLGTLFSNGIWKPESKNTKMSQEIQIIIHDSKYFTACIFQSDCIKVLSAKNVNKKKSIYSKLFNFSPILIVFLPSLFRMGTKPKELKQLEMRKKHVNGLLDELEYAKLQKKKLQHMKKFNSQKNGKQPGKKSGVTKENIKEKTVQEKNEEHVLKEVGMNEEEEEEMKEKTNKEEKEKEKKEEVDEMK
ncbi:extracellular matrix protein 2-related [Anaeramoeba flamelloides]|uniref:Extracellular matrix protein 2-related n=1 Tax=Anaeramoeba flamelloides TaxID=1746091 RepID=A0AAV8AJN3_9EUKA|nr:extracellular matrix protein 2-related [Anaeramoeba flamelloides]